MSLLASEQLPMGSAAIPFSLLATNNETISLDTFSENKGFLILFTSNHCPYAKASWGLINDLYAMFGSDIGFVAINSNDPVGYPEDSFEKMGEYVQKYDVAFPYAFDETQEVARSYKAQCTPDPYLYKKVGDRFELFYHGRISNHWFHKVSSYLAMHGGPKEQRSNIDENLKDAMQRLLSGEPSPEEQPPSLGCSIKWK